uniref:Ferritin n=1 Tax=Cynoglossus semilaevis TaxID=244447 RepID=A0A3P8WY75_CYNSE
ATAPDCQEKSALLSLSLVLEIVPKYFYHWSLNEIPRNSICKPSRDDWKGGLDAMSFSLDFQKSLNACILEVHRRADGNTDPHLCDFLEQNFLEDSYDTIKKLGDYNKSLTSITASDTHGSLGEYLFDKHTL